MAAAAASLLALRELVDGILAQCLSTARQLDRLQMHADLSKVRLKRVSRRTASSALWRLGCGRTKSARLGFEACMAYCSDDDECDAAETDDEVEVRLSGHVETSTSERLCGRACARRHLHAAAASLFAPCWHREEG